MKIIIDCINNFIQKSNFQIDKYNIGKELGRGLYSIVYEGEKNGKIYALKFLCILKDAYEKAYIKEANITELMAKNNISPKYYGYIIIDNIFVIITEKYDISLSQYEKGSLYSRLPSSLYDSLKNKLYKMYDLGIWQGDLGKDNVMLKMGNGLPVKIAIIDYGLASPIKDKEIIEEHINNFLDEIKKIEI